MVSFFTLVNVAEFDGRFFYVSVVNNSMVDFFTTVNVWFVKQLVTAGPPSGGLIIRAFFFRNNNSDNLVVDPC